jgi:ABC-type uncharacterized transport system substrate-binding protein
MSAFCHKILFHTAVIFILSVSFGVAADKKPYSASPPVQISKKWRIGYLEGGKYKDYQKVLIATVDGLMGMGWIEKISIPEQENKEDNRNLWAWLAANAKSKYLEFAADAYYSDDWKTDRREQTKNILLSRLREAHDIDLMLALGTWAGQDLANNEHSVPTIVCSVTDAIGSKIVKSVSDSGYDHVHARLDPTRYERQIRSFHEVIGFKKLGVAFEDTEVGRSYAAIGDIEKVSKERKFEVIPCHFKAHDVSKEEAEAGVIKCAGELAPKIDAFYLTTSSGLTLKSLPKILEPMNAHKIPTFSQAGIEEVKRGVLLSVSQQQNFKYVGMFQAQTIAKIINGAKPRDLEMVYEAPVKSAFNAAAAKKISLKPETYDLLLWSSVEVYKEIEADK